MTPTAGTTLLDRSTAIVRAGVDTVLRDLFAARHAQHDDPAWRECTDLVAEFVLSPGKRTRPAFCHLGWTAYGGDEHPGIITVAAALELFHAFALVHDDVMDDSDTRRGRPALHVQLTRWHRSQRWRDDAQRFGRNAAILWGDLCLVWSTELFLGCGMEPARLQVALDLLHRMRREVLLGQYLDLAGQASAVASLDQCLTILRYKSARYTVERPLQIGAALAGASSTELAGLSRYGIPVGEAFQLRDDLLGVFGDDAVTGKSTLTDLRDGKSTVLMALARQRADAEQAVGIHRWHGDPQLDEQGAAALREIVSATHSPDMVEQMISSRTVQAVAALDDLCLTAEARLSLADMAHRLSGRRR